MKLTHRAAQAFTNLRGNPDFGDLLMWIAEIQAKETKTCIDAEGVTLHRAQGAAKALQQLRVAYDESPSTVLKLRAKEREVPRQ